MTTSSPPLLEVLDLRVHFPIRRGILISRSIDAVRAVDGVSFSMAAGETLGLVGESGSGKTTIARTVATLQRPTSGSVILDGQDLQRLRGKHLRAARGQLGLVFQNPHSSLDPRMPVGSIVAEPLHIHGIGSPGERRRRAADLLAAVGISPDLAIRYPHQFSGGQQQRIAIARALAASPALLVADEPISALDVSIQAQILNLLRELQNGTGVALLLVAHNLAAVSKISDRIAVLYLGRIVELAATQDLLDHPKHPYTIALLSAVPIPDPRAERQRKRIILKGDIPSPADPPSGCPFHTRCWLREQLGRPQQCESEVPALRPQGTGHLAACHFTEAVDPASSREAVPTTGGEA